jgi:hypothetical protein
MRLGFSSFRPWQSIPHRKGQNDLSTNILFEKSSILLGLLGRSPLLVTAGGKEGTYE